MAHHSHYLLEDLAPDGTAYADAVRFRTIGKAQALSITAIVLVGLNLRPIANGFGAAIPAVRADLDLSATAAGVLNALPGACFVVFGLLAPGFAARVGAQRAVVSGLVAMAIGQVLRVAVSDIWAVFAGSVVALAGTAVINILLPGLVRTLFPRHVAVVTAVYTTCMMTGATAGSGLTIPIARAFGTEWRGGVGIWTILAIVALVPWVTMLVTRSDTMRPRHASTVPLRTLLRNSVAWWIALFFAMQAMQAYIITGWLSQILVDAGVDLTLAGTAVAAFAAAGLPMAMVIPMVARRQTRFPAIVVGLATCYLIGYTGLLLSPSSGYLLWAALLGSGGGAFPFAMLIVAIRARSFDALTALSAFAQSTAYLFATIGPFVIGLLHDVTHGWTVPIWAMIGAAVAMGGFGLLAVRPRYVDDVPPVTAQKAT